MDEAVNVEPETEASSDFDGTYKLWGEIKTGSRSVVYHAEQQKLGTEVAIKVLRERLPEDPLVREELNDELRRLSAIDHPNLVAISGFGIVGDAPYIAMELLEGDTLAERLTQALIEPELVEQLTLAMLRALAHLHVRGVVHGNLNPNSVFLQKDADGGVRLKLIDYRLTRLPANQNADRTQVAPAPTALPYMAPEHATGEDADARSDVYAAGAIIREMMTGDVTQLLRPKDAPQFITTPFQAFHSFLGRALETDKHERFRNGDQMLRALLDVPTPWFERTLVQVEEDASHAEVVRQDGTSEFPLLVDPEPYFSPPPPLPRKRAPTSRKLMAAGVLVALGAAGWALAERLREPTPLADTRLGSPGGAGGPAAEQPAIVGPPVAEQAALTRADAVAPNARGAAAGAPPSPEERTPASAQQAKSADPHAAAKPAQEPLALQPAAAAEALRAQLATRFQQPPSVAFPAPLARDPRSGVAMQSLVSPLDPDRAQPPEAPLWAAFADQNARGAFTPVEPAGPAPEVGPVQQQQPGSATQLTASARAGDAAAVDMAARGVQARAERGPNAAASGQVPHDPASTGNGGRAQPSAIAELNGKPAPTIPDPHGPAANVLGALPGTDAHAAANAQPAPELPAAADTQPDVDWPPSAANAQRDVDWPPSAANAQPDAKPRRAQDVDWPPSANEDAAPAAVPEQPSAAIPEPPPPLAAKADGSVRHVRPSSTNIRELLKLVHAVEPERGAPSDPWVGPLPAELQALREAIARGEPGTPQQLSTLRRFNRENPDVAYGHLLIAGLYRNRGWSLDALDQYELAYRKDPSARGAPEMLADSLLMVMDGVADADAARFITRSFQREALPVIDEALKDKGLDAAASARLKKLRSRIASGAR